MPETDQTQSTPTTAQLVSEQFDDDGLTWESRMGSLEDVAMEHGARRTEIAGDVRYQFSDGSAIVACESAWDIGFDDCDDCFCWAGVAGDYPETGGHNEQCEHAHPER